MKKSSTEDLGFSLRHCIEGSFLSIETNRNSFTTTMLMRQFDLEILGIATFVLLCEVTRTHWRKKQVIVKGVMSLCVQPHCRKSTVPQERGQIQAGNAGHAVRSDYTVSAR